MSVLFRLCVLSFSDKEVVRMSKKPVLSLQNVSYSYHPGRPVLKNISLTVSAGEKIAILGANGAGKSTLFLLMDGVLRPESGTVTFAGETITGKNLTLLRKGVGIIFQDADHQMIAPSVKAEVSFGPMNLKLPEKEVKKRVNEALSFMNLDGFQERPPHYLSGGEKKRVSIADIIAMQPEVFLFDEPASSLDPIGKKQLEDVLARLSETGKTLLISTHDVDFAYRWAERILVFQNGTLRAEGTAPQIFSQDELLKETNLTSPTIFQIYHLLKEKNLLRENGRTLSEVLPRTVQELEALL